MDAEELLQKGIAAHKAGDLGEAVRNYRAVLGFDPDNPDAHNLMSVIALQANDAKTSVAFAARATQLRPDWFAPWISLGNAHQAQGNPAAAVDAFQKAVMLNPGSAEAYTNLASALNLAGSFNKAIDAAVKAIVIDGGIAEAHINFGNALMGMNSPGEAQEAFEKAARLQPDNPAAWTNLGSANLALGHHAEAVEACERAVMLGAPAEARTCRGEALLALGEFERAAEDFAVLVQHFPHNIDAHNNLALAYERQGHLDQAIDAMRAAVAKAPEDGGLHLNLAFMLLRAGRYEEGWREYEWRWHAPHFQQFRRDFPMPSWQGEDLAGKSILVHAEQGFGDALQFCRYAPLLAARGAKVALECRKGLARLFSTLDGVEVLDPDAQRAGFDFVVAQMSLPLRFGTTLDTVPAAIPYLKVPPGTQSFADIAALDGLKVGLVWGGSRTRTDNAARSLPLAEIESLLAVPGTRFFSLQVGAEGGLPAGLADLAPRLADFADTAAAVDALDLVISVDTAVAHLAGALGKPVWVLLSRPSNGYLWMEETFRSPWYPTARLYRQNAPGEWAGVIGRVRSDLAVLGAGR